MDITQKKRLGSVLAPCAFHVLRFLKTLLNHGVPLTAIRTLPHPSRRLGAAGLADKDGFGFFRYHSNTLLGRKVSKTRSNAWKSDDVRTGKTEKKSPFLVNYLPFQLPILYFSGSFDFFDYTKIVQFLTKRKLKIATFIL